MHEAVTEVTEANHGAAAPWLGAPLLEGRSRKSLRIRKGLRTEWGTRKR